MNVQLARSSRCWAQRLGRSTTAKAIMGLVEATGSVVWRGRNCWAASPSRSRTVGLGYVPENRDIFPSSPCTRT